MLSQLKKKEKKVIKPTRVVGLTTLAVVASGAYATTAEASTTHTVRAGDTLSAISQQNNVTVSQLRQWNNLDSDMIRIGQVLRLSASTTSDQSTGSSTSNTTSTHTVVAGDTLFAIAQRNNVTVNQLRQWNNLQTDIIRVGQVLRLSASTTSDHSTVESTSNTTSIHTVVAGDTLFTIAQRNGVTVNQLRQWNNLQTDVLQIGQVLQLSGQTSNNTGGETNTSTASGTRVVTASSLNVRSGASTNHSVIGSLTKNQAVTVTGKTNGWYTIDFNGRTGYISANFVTEQTNNANNNTNTSNGNGGNSGNTSSSSVDVQSMISFAKRFIGVPYVWGGSSPSGFDCSGFIFHVLNNSGVSISRTNVEGYWNSNRFQTVSSPQAGDLIFFQNTWRQGPSHMGIMINSTQFIHASSSNGVVITNVSNSFWSQHFLGYKRM